MTNNLSEIQDRLKLILSEVSKLRKDTREILGGITYQFGIYTLNVPDNEAFFHYLENHFVDIEKLLIAYKNKLENYDNAK